MSPHLLLVDMIITPSRYATKSYIQSVVSQMNIPMNIAFAPHLGYVKPAKQYLCMWKYFFDRTPLCKIFVNHECPKRSYAA